MPDSRLRMADYFDAMRASENWLPSLRQLDETRLPRAVRGLVRLIGLPATLKLVEDFGGLTLRLPVGAREVGQALLEDLARRIGPEASRILARHYAATPLYVPNCKPALLRARDASLLADRQRLVGEGLSERQIVQCLAIRYRLSERHVWTILKKPPPADTARQPQQGSLF